MKSPPRKSKRSRRAPGKAAGGTDLRPGGSEVYCTECGATLENFCFSSAAGDLDAIRKTLAQCRRQGRFSGEFCSKLFIAHPEALPHPENGSGDEPAA
jgi:hypothetical protein